MSAEPDLGSITPDERRLLRLFRCLNREQQDVALRSVGQLLLKGLPSPPWLEHPDPDNDDPEDPLAGLADWLTSESGWLDHPDLCNLDDSWSSIVESSWGNQAPTIVLEGSWADSHWATC